MAWGTLRTFDVTDDDEIAVRRQIVDYCLDSDVNLIDTAAWYGHAEAGRGRDHRGPSGPVLHRHQGAHREGKEAGEAQIARSFELLKTDYIDLFQVHNMIDWQTHLPPWSGLKARAKSACWACPPWCLMPIHHHGPDAPGSSGRVQIPYNVMNRGVEDELLPLAEELGTGILVMEPLQKGRYVLDLTQQPDLTPLRDYSINTWAQALLAWVIPTAG